MAKIRSTAVSRAVPLTLAGAAVVGAVVAGVGPVSADPADPGTTPVAVTTVPADAPPAPADPSGMTPQQAPAASGDPAPAPVGHQKVPEIPNQSYGSGGGIFGSLKDLWHQVQDPMLQSQMTGSGNMATPPQGAGPAPALPPGYVSTNAPGSETASTNGGGGPATGRPALPPGYYSIAGPPPPGYQYGSSGLNATAPAAPTVVAPPTVITAYPTP